MTSKKLSFKRASFERHVSTTPMSYNIELASFGSQVVFSMTPLRTWTPRHGSKMRQVSVKTPEKRLDGDGQKIG